MLDKKVDEAGIIADLLSWDTLNLEEFDSFLASWKGLADQHGQNEKRCKPYQENSG